MKSLWILLVFMLSQRTFAIDCASSAQAKPAMKKNSVIGFQIYKVVKDGQWQLRGFKSKDILIEANGIRVNSFQQFAEVMPLICDAKHGTFKVIRNGSPIDLTF